MTCGVARTTGLNSLVRLPAPQRALIAAATCQCRAFSVLNRPPPNYEGHVPLTTIERAALGLSSAIGSLLNVRRHDLIATVGETTATPYFIYRLRDAMLKSATGRRILRDRPRITSQTMSLAQLRTLPDASVGRTYAAWLDREGVTPDTRDGVKYIDDAECAYVMQRYRESHDFYHAVTGLPVFTEGELALKAFEFANTGLPMTGLALGALVRLKPAERRRFLGIGAGDDAPGGYLGWALSNGLRADAVINVYWEEELATPVADLRARLGIQQPPDLRVLRKAARDKKRAAREAAERLGGLTKN